MLGALAVVEELCYFVIGLVCTSVMTEPQQEYYVALQNEIITDNSIARN